MAYEEDKIQPLHMPSYFIEDTYTENPQSTSSANRPAEDMKQRLPCQ